MAPELSFVPVPVIVPGTGTIVAAPKLASKFTVSPLTTTDFDMGRILRWIGVALALQERADACRKTAERAPQSRRLGEHQRGVAELMT
jgi:hypothetical protein